MTHEETVRYAVQLFGIGYEMLERALETANTRLTIDPQDRFHRNDVLTLKRSIASIEYARRILNNNL